MVLIAVNTPLLVVELLIGKCLVPATLCAGIVLGIWMVLISCTIRMSIQELSVSLITGTHTVFQPFSACFISFGHHGML